MFNWIVSDKHKYLELLNFVDLYVYKSYIYYIWLNQI